MLGSTQRVTIRCPASGTVRPQILLRVSLARQFHSPQDRWRNAMLDLGDAPSGIETNHTNDCGEMLTALVSMDVEVSAKMKPTISRTRYFSLAGQRGAEEVESEGLVWNQRHPTRTRRACLRNPRRPPIFISQSRCTTLAPRSKSSVARPHCSSKGARLTASFDVRHQHREGFGSSCEETRLLNMG